MRNLLSWLVVGAVAWVAAGCGVCDRNAKGNICTVAGTGKNGYSGDDGPALKAELSLPQDTLVHPNGDLYVLDWNNHRIRKVTPDGTIRHVAGRGELGGTLDDPLNSDFNHPTGMVLSPSGEELFVAAWHNSKIRTLVLSTGEIRETCGDGRRAYFGDDKPALTGSLDLPTSIAWDPKGELIIMDQANQVLRRIDSQGTLRLVAGRCVVDDPPPNGPGVCAAGVEPTACAAPSGKHFCGGAPSEMCARPCTPGYDGDEVPAARMRLSQPFGQSADPGGRLAYDSKGNLYFADPGNSLIRMIDTQGVVHRVVGVAPVAGKPQRGYSGDEGPATSALVNNPVDLAFGEDGTLYFTDVYNHCVRAVDPQGVIHTVAGQCGKAGTEGEGVSATEALLKRPYGIDISGGVLYISDTGNNQIRAVKL